MALRPARRHHRPGASASDEAAIRVRQAREADVEGVAALCVEVFGVGTPPNGFPRVSLPGRPRTQEEWASQLQAALQRKSAAQRATLELRLHPPERPGGRETRGAGAAAARAAQAERQQLERWRRQRQFVCLVAEQRASGRVVACAAVTLARPQANLPPPFPTASPVRCYASNMAVVEGHRRRGVASALLARCEAVARLWRYDSLWLHVDEGNDAAVGLYERSGYEEQRRSLFLRAKKQRLLRKELAPRQHAAPPPPPPAIGGSRVADGVFIWNVDGVPPGS